MPYCCQSCWHHHLGHWGDGFFQHVRDPLSHMFCCYGGRKRVMGEPLLCSVLYFPGLCHCDARQVGGQNHECLWGWRDSVPGSATTVGQLTVAMGITAAWKLKSYVPPTHPAATGFFGAQLPQAEKQDYRHCLCSSPISASSKCSSPLIFGSTGTWNSPAF